jgi:hypothetical protein
MYRLADSQAEAHNRPKPWPDGRLAGRFGTDVLAELIKGIDEFTSDVAGRRQRWARRDGPAMLGRSCRSMTRSFWSGSRASTGRASRS